MSLFLAIAGAIALGIVVAKIAILTVQWLIGRVKTMMQLKNVKKVAAIQLERMIDECPNTTTLEDLMNEGVDAVIAAVDYDGKIEKIEGVAAQTIDDGYLNRMGDEQMIVING